MAPFDYLFKGRGGLRGDLRGGSRRLPGGQGAGREAPSGSPGTSRRRTTRTASKQVAGDGWVLVGDAFGFLDPLYSSGVLLALKSGEHGRRRDRRRASRRATRRRPSSASGAGVQRRRGPHAAARVRVLRRLQLRQVRQELPAPARQGHGSAHRRPVHDGVDEVWEPMESLYSPARRASPPGRSRPTPTTPSTRPTSSCYPRAGGPSPRSSELFVEAFRLRRKRRRHLDGAPSWP